MKSIAALIAIILFFACTVDAHAWMSSPSPRGQYRNPKKQSHEEYSPTAGNTPFSSELVCRNDPVMPKASWLPLTAGKSQSITIEYNAVHPGDCFVYLTYDGDKPENQMKWFKIWQQHECYKQTNFNIPIPSYLPSGEHVIFRWEWYALHAFPTVEFYTQCVDAVMTGTSSGLLPQPQVNIPGHLPTLVGGFLSNNNNYWWPYDNQPMFFTGPKIASLDGQPQPTQTPEPTVPATRPPTQTPTNPPTRPPTTPPTQTPTNPPTRPPTTPPTQTPTNPPTRPPTRPPTPTTPATRPPTTPPSPPSVAPTTRPTDTPSGSVKLVVNPSSSVWWFACSFQGQGASDISKIEIKDSGSVSSFKTMTNDWGNVYAFNPSAEFVLPLTVKVSLPSGSSITFTVESFSGEIEPTQAPAPTTKPNPTYTPTETPTIPATRPPTQTPTTPATRPPTTPPSPPSVAPTTRPTNAPAHSVKLVVNPSSSSWWFACNFEGHRASEISKIEIKDSGAVSTFEAMNNEWADVYAFNPDRAALVLPFTIKASLPSGSSITFTVNSLSGSTIDSGSVFP